MLPVALLYDGLVFLLLFGLSSVIEQTVWSGMRYFHPELAYGLIVGAASISRP
jgi:hypothetical protein